MAVSERSAAVFGAGVSAGGIAKRREQTALSRDQKLRAALRDSQFLTEQQRAGLFGRLDTFFQESGKIFNIGKFDSLAGELETELGTIQQTVEQRQKAISASLEAQRQNVNPRLNSREKIAATYFGATNQPKSAGGSSFVSAFAPPPTAAQQGTSRR